MPSRQSPVESKLPRSIIILPRHVGHSKHTLIVDKHQSSETCGSETSRAAFKTIETLKYQISLKLRSGLSFRSLGLFLTILFRCYT